MLEYTGHPFVDVGAATIAAFVKKPDLAEITEADLNDIADYITRHYPHRPLSSMAVIMFINSGFVQPSFKKYPERRVAYANQVLRGYQEGRSTLPETCVFCPRPAAMRAYREHIPLASSRKSINFYAEGDVGLPICGHHLLCMHAFPLGGAMCEGRVLIVHADNPELTYEFARRFLEHNMREVTLLEPSNSKMVGHKYRKTVLVNTLLEIERERSILADEGACSVSAYWLTNYGTSANIDMFHLPLQTVRFLQIANSHRYARAWNEVVHRAWQEITRKKGGEKVTYRRNWLYEDLFDLPDNAAGFLRRYLLRQPLRKTRRIGKDDPRLTYSLRTEANLVSWDLTQLFLQEVMNMDKIRIEAIRQLGDRLANYVQIYGENILKEIMLARGYPKLRLILIRANNRVTQGGQPPLLTFDDFIEVFEVSAETARHDWSLARDLVLVRMVEQLYAAEWFKQHQDILKEEIVEAES